MKTSAINRPTVAQAMELLGKRVVCKVFWDDGLSDPPRRAVILRLRG